jgi:salicylate hydroxylase
LQERARTVQASDVQVVVQTETGRTFVAPALLGCDGLWSMVRKHVMGGPDGNLDAPPRFSGHLAYRGLLDADRVPEALRGIWVNAWLGPRLHVVHYPVSGGRQVNVVAVVHGRQTGNPQSWSHEANRTELMQALGPVHSTLAGLLDAVDNWKLWPLNDRPPMTGDYAHALGRVALAGDAAHPLRPYLAQGAAMALEDAWTLGRQLQAAPQGQVLDWPGLFQHFARVRWRRNSRVQARSARNGRIFHAEGAFRAARNLAMAALGEHLLDNPWLYSGPPNP